MDPEDARDAFAARALIEIECAGLAARHATKAEAAAIHATLDVGEAAIAANDTRALAAMDEAFHVAVARATHNRTLAKLVMSLHHATVRFWLVSAGTPSLEENRAAVAQHRALADAIAAGDVARAQKAMRAALGEFPGAARRDAGLDHPGLRQPDVLSDHRGDISLTGRGAAGDGGRTALELERRGQRIFPAGRVLRHHQHHSRHY